MNLDPRQLSIRDAYTWMVGLITPRPIAWVSTLAVDGVTNLAPFSFFNGVGANPPTIMFCPANRRDGSRKDTLKNIERTGQFVVNLVTASVVEAMNLTAGEYPPEVDEFSVANIDSAASSCVDPPRVAQCMAALECELHQTIHVGFGPGGANVVIGRILAMYVDDALVDDEGGLITQSLDTIGRMGGLGYVRTSDRFDLPRPRVGL